jgi:hypothetical protein
MTVLLADPGHRTATLVDTSGHPAGSATWGPGSGQLVVVANGLAFPAPGATYRCWVESHGVRTWIGRMEFAAGEAYWVGSAAWDLTIAAGTRFGVSLVAGSASSPGAPVVLTGTF